MRERSFAFHIARADEGVAPDDQGSSAIDDDADAFSSHMRHELKCALKNIFNKSEDSSSQFAKFVLHEGREPKHSMGGETECQLRRKLRRKQRRRRSSQF
jgi:hypothetical protein